MTIKYHSLDEVITDVNNSVMISFEVMPDADRNKLYDEISYDMVHVKVHIKTNVFNVSLNVECDTHDNIEIRNCHGIILTKSGVSDDDVTLNRHNGHIISIVSISAASFVKNDNNIIEKIKDINTNVMTSRAMILIEKLKKIDRKFVVTAMNELSVKEVLDS